MRAIFKRFLWEHRWAMSATLVLMLVAFPVEQLAFPTIYGNIVDILGKPSRASLFARTKWYLIGAVMLLMLSQVMFTLIDTVDAYTLPALQSFYRDRLLGDVFSTFQQAYETLPTGDVVSKIVKLPIVIRHLYHQCRNYVMPAVIVSVCACLYYCYLDWSLGLVLAVVLIGFYAYAVWRAGDCVPISQERDATCDTLHADVDDTLSNLLTVYTHNRVHHETRRFERQQRKHDELYTASSLCAVRFKVWFSVFYTALFVIVNGYAFYLTHTKRLSVGSLVTVIFVNLFLIGNIQDFAGEIRDFVYNLGVLAETQVYMDRLFARTLPLPPSRPLPATGGAVTFDGVTYRYPDQRDKGNRAALRNVSLSIPAGQTVVVVGSIGSGKSTLVKLLLRLFTPQRGTVRIDGADLSKYTPQAVRRRVGYVPQSPMLFDRSLYANLVYGTSPAPSKRAVRAFVRRMGVGPLFANVPGGLDTQVGKHGERLSGGQRQAVVLLRLALSDASGTPRTVLLLDEPTSALDKTSKQYVLALLARLAKKRTTIVVTHDPDVVPLADRVVTFRDGRVVEG